MTGTTPTETSVREVTDRDFEVEVEKSPEPTVVIFVSDACPHCRTLMPYVEGFARDFRNRVRFVTMDVVANPWTAERYGVRGTPTFKFFCHGRPVQELVGAIPRPRSDARSRSSWSTARSASGSRPRSTTRSPGTDEHTILIVEERERDPRDANRSARHRAHRRAPGGRLQQRPAVLGGRRERAAVC